MKTAKYLALALSLGAMGISSAAMATNIATLADGATFVSASSAINLSGYDDNIAALDILSGAGIPAYSNGDTRYIFDSSDTAQSIIIKLGSTYSISSFAATFGATDRTPSGLTIAVSLNGDDFTSVSGITTTTAGGGEYVFTPTSKVSAEYIEYSFGPATGGNGSGISRLVADVPEPATWALMLTGFGLIGFGMRRRARTTVVYG